MKTEVQTKEATIEPHYNFEKVPHPKTGEVNVLELIRYTMKHIHSMCGDELEMDGGYAIVKLNVSSILNECGLPTGAVPGFQAVMQNMGLLKCANKHTWRVIHSDANEYFITAQAYLLAREQWVKHKARNKEVTDLRKALKEAQQLGQAQSGTPVQSSDGDELAVEALALAEQYEEERDAAKVRVSELETELAAMREQVQTLGQQLAKCKNPREALAEWIAAKKAALKKA